MLSCFENQSDGCLLSNIKWEKICSLLSHHHQLVGRRASMMNAVLGSNRGKQ